MQLARAWARWDERIRQRLPRTVAIRDLGGSAGAAPRLIEPRSTRPAAPVIVYIPGRWCNTRLWALDEPGRDIRIALADAGFASITVDLRCGEHADGRCRATKLDGVRTAELLHDVAAARALVGALLPARRVVLCGFSMGASLAFLAAGRESADGLIALDGGLPERPLSAQSPSGCLANPYRHSRYVRSALALIEAGASQPATADELRWRLTQDQWWPAGQVDEIRTGMHAHGEPLADLLPTVCCPILCVATDERDDRSHSRSLMTAQRTSATWTQLTRLNGWRHTEVMTRSRADDDGMFESVVRFLERV